MYEVSKQLLTIKTESMVQNEKYQLEKQFQGGLLKMYPSLDGTYLHAVIIPADHKNYPIAPFCIAMSAEDGPLAAEPPSVLKLDVATAKLAMKGSTAGGVIEQWVPLVINGSITNLLFVKERTSSLAGTCYFSLCCTVTL